MPKDEKKSEFFEIDWKLKGNSRKELRDAAVKKFLEEKGGYWKSGFKYVTKFKYFVEKLNDGRRVYLLRPTHLNKGIDFQVWVEKFKDKEDGRPGHNDIFADLRGKQQEDPELIEKLLNAIDLVWECEEPDEVLKKYTNLDFKTGFSAEMLLKILKWLFIEQDITYWNYDGRGMLRKAINMSLGFSEDSPAMKEFFQS